jgi:hypothetical protein
MNTYKITIFNLISEKKVRLTIDAINMTKAIEIAECKIHYTSEEIIKCEKL